MAFRHYRKNFLETVVFQLRFPLILTLDNASPGEFQGFVRERFPNARTAADVSVEVLLSQEAFKAEKTEKKTFRPRWIFLDKDETASVTVSSDVFTLEYKKFTDVDDALADFSFAWEAFQRVYQVKKIDRIGVRYIDNIVLPSGEPFDWEGYVNREVVDATFGVAKSIADESYSLLRTMHALYLGTSDHAVLFQFGMNNSDFPNPIAKRAFVLDYDCFSVGATEASEAQATVKRYNGIIHELFERTIGEKLRQELGVIEATGA